MAQRFLIIDDSYIDRLVASMLVKRSWDDADVVEANGGAHALECLSTLDLREGEQLVVLLDIMMPQMNGFQFLENFENVDSAIKEKTVVVMLSSTIDPDDMDRAARHPRVKKLLSKPLSAEALRHAL